MELSDGVAMFMGAVRASILWSGADVSWNKGKVESSKSDSRRAEST